MIVQTWPGSATTFFTPSTIRSVPMIPLIRSCANPTRKNGTKKNAAGDHVEQADDTWSARGNLHEATPSEPEDEGRKRHEILGNQEGDFRACTSRARAA